jgi:type I restriction enzyme M protein
MPKSSSSYTKLPSVPSALLKEDGIQVERANPNTILQTPLRISALSRFKIQHSSFPFLPGRLFYCTQIPACLWFLTKLKGARTLLSASRTKEFIRSRKAETLFIDARKLGTLIDRVQRQLTDADLEKIVSTYHEWRSEGRAAGPPAAAPRRVQDNTPYQDIPGFCKSATTAEIAAHGHVLTPARYVGAEEVKEDGELCEKKMLRLVAELHGQFPESAKLGAAIRANLKGLGYE